MRRQHTEDTPNPIGAVDHRSRSGAGRGPPDLADGLPMGPHRPTREPKGEQLLHPPAEQPQALPERLKALPGKALAGNKKILRKPTVDAIAPTVAL